MNFIDFINFQKVPEGYITGLDRNNTNTVANLYEGTFGEVGNPMCRRCWNRRDGHGFSIFRNNVGRKGICKVCMRRALNGLKGVKAKENPQNYNYYY